MVILSQLVAFSATNIDGDLIFVKTATLLVTLTQGLLLGFRVPTGDAGRVNHQIGVGKKLYKKPRQIPVVWQCVMSEFE